MGVSLVLLIFMNEISAKQDMSWGQWFRWKRRKLVYHYGKRLVRLSARIYYAQSKVGDAAVLDRHHFPFLDEFEGNWELIRDEVREILKHREAVPLFHEVSPDQAGISRGKNWRTFIMYGFGERLEKNCAQAPVTAGLLAKVPDIQTAWFSILSPGYEIPAHTGVTTGILRAHLGLIIPKDAKNCTLSVADEVCMWQPGEAFVFDDTYRHSVSNNTDEERVILIFDFDRPMRFWGRLLNKTIIKLVKQSAYFKVPKQRMKGYEDRFEAAVQAADDAFEKLSDIDS